MRRLKNMKEKIMILLIVSVILCICITAVFVVSEMLHPTVETASLVNTIKVVEQYAQK